MMTRAPVSRSYSPGLVVQIDVTVVPFEGFRAIVDDMDACDCRCEGYGNISMKFLIFLNLMMMINMIFGSKKVFIAVYLIFKKRVISIPRMDTRNYIKINYSNLQALIVFIFNSNDYYFSYPIK